MANSEQIVVRVPPELMETLRAEAKRQERTVSQQVRHWLKQELEERN